MERRTVTAPQKKIYGSVLALGLLLLVSAGAGAYRAIRSLLSVVGSHQPFDPAMTGTVTDMAVMVTVCFAAAFIIALTSILITRQEFDRRRRTEDRLDRVMQTSEQAGDLITILETGGQIEYINHAVEEATGYLQKDLVGRRSTPWLPWYGEADRLRDMRDAVLAGNAFRAVVTCRKQDGTAFFLQEHATPLRDRNGKITRMLSTAREITEQKHLEDKLAFLDRHDPLTEAPNRKEFVEQLDRAIAAAGQAKRFLSILILDIDRFKYINDIFGYEMGDRVLRKIAALLRSTAGSEDLLARLGSDEFAVAHLGDQSQPDAAGLASRIKDAIAADMRISGQDIVVTVTMGIAVFPPNGSDAETLVKNADMALSRAKTQGRNTVQFFSADIGGRMSDFYFMEKRLFKALRNNEYLVNYQPYWDLSTKKIAGAEALVRWKSGDLGVVSPSRFIPTLEDTGLIIDVGEWVLRTACGQIGRWARNGTGLPVSVNLSLIQFRNKYLVGMVADAIREHNLDPRHLTLEVTESICIHDMDLAIATLKKLKDVGVSISVDDFGTGYSSLNYIKKLPVDNLKIDMSFIRDVAKDPDAASIVTAITGMARSLNLKTIAEGVETEEQRNILHLLRCDMGQGFYFSPAVSAEEFDRFLVS
jgi:diguanylate cyclase (GGDEF)-like protein/PAS domain S-box-containing protein